MDIEERMSGITTGKYFIIGEGISAHTLKDDGGEHHTTHTKMAYAPSSKHHLIVPQWLGMQDKE